MEIKVKLHDEEARTALKRLAVVGTNLAYAITRLITREITKLI